MPRGWLAAKLSSITIRRSVSPNNRLVSSTNLGFLFFSLAAFSICLIANFFFEQPRTLFLFDSTHYFETTQGLVALVLDTLHHRNSLNPEQYHSFLQHIRLDGPLLPLLLGAPFMLLNKHPEFSDFKLLIIFQCALQGLTAGFVWLLSLRLSSNKWSSALATLAFIFYPPTVLQTQRILSEPAACLLMAAFAWLITARRCNIGAGIVVGAFAAILGLLKTALILPACLAVIVRATLYRSRSAARFAGATIVGLILALLPWILFTRNAFHQTLLFADREPAVNLALGFDLETGGLPATYRGPFSKLVFDLDHPYRSALDLLSTHPVQYAQLFATKAARLVMYPWNDFRHSFLGCEPGTQFMYHAILLLLGISGIFILCLAPARCDSPRWRSAVICLAMILAHGVYLLVQPNPRYLITAAPLLCAFISFGLAGLRTLAPGRLNLALTAAALVATLICAVGNLTGFANSERRVVLNSGDSLTRTFKRNQLESSTDLNSAFVLIDGDKLSSDVKVSVNGVLIDVPLQRIYEYDQNPDCQITYGLMNTVARYSGFASGETFRQWRAVPVPHSLLKDGINSILVQQTGGSSVIIANAVGDRRLPTLTLWGFERAVLDPLCLDGRFENPVLCAAGNPTERFTLSQPGVGSKVLDSSPRIKLLLAAGFPQGSHSPLQAQTATVEADFTGLTARVSSKVPVKTDGLILPVQPQLSTAKYFLRLTGEAMRTAGTGNASIQFLAVDPRGAKRPGIMPTRITAAPTWTRFVLDGTIDLKGVPEVAALELQFFPKDQELVEEFGLRRGCSDVQFRNLHIKLSPDNLPRGNFSQYIIL